jgi:hypothetical protein
MFRHLIVRRSASSIAVLWSIAIAFASTARAQTQEDPNIVAAARALAVEGVKLAQDGHCDDAIDKLQRAEQLRHSAIVLEQLGECYIEHGRFVEGAEAMRSVLREGIPENASEAMARAHANARTKLDATKGKIAMLTLTVEVEGKAQPEVEVDGQVLPPALIGAARPTDPGEHTIEASAPGHLPVKRRVALTPGQTDAVSLTLVVDPAASARAAAVANASEAPATPTAPEAPAPATTAEAKAIESPSHVPSYIAWGAAGVALAVGVGYGWVAMDQKSDLDRVCPAKSCPPEQSDRLDTAKTNGLISTIAFGVAIGAAVTGGVLLILESSAASEPQPKAANIGRRVRLGVQAPDSSRASLRLSPTGAALQMKF